MKFLRNKAVTFLIFSIILVITLVVYTIFLYTGILQSNAEKMKTVTFIIGIILFFLLGLLSGQKEQSKGWLAGCSSGFTLLFLVIIFKLTSGGFTTWFIIVKYISYLFASILGGILGVQFPTLHKATSKKREK